MVPGPDPSAAAVGGSDPAPGPLRLIQSFANTRGAAPDTDLLHSREEAAAWLRAAALLPAEAGLTGSEHAALLRLRESVRDILAARTDGREDPAADAADTAAAAAAAAAADAAGRLTKALADGRLVLTAGPASTMQLASAARASYPSLVATLAIALAESAASGTWPRLKSCSDPHCGQAFYDDSASCDARRCSMHVSGR